MMPWFGVMVCSLLEAEEHRLEQHVIVDIDVL